MPTTADCSGRAEAGNDPLELRKMSHEALVRLVYQYEEDQSRWRAAWKYEQRRRLAAEAALQEYRNVQVQRS